MVDWNRVRMLQDEVGEEDFDEIVELFLEEVETVISKMSEAPNRGEFGEDLHFLKGSALSIGFARFSKLCQAGETAAEQGQEATVDLQEIISSFEESKKEFLEGLPALAG